MPLPSKTDPGNHGLEGYEQWLIDQGAAIVSCRPLYQAVMSPVNVNQTPDLCQIEMQRVLDEQKLYKIEASTGVIKRWKRQSDQMEAAMEWASMSTHGHVGSYYTDQYQRHLRLLVENPMYRTAWQEFQQVRILLGETTQWP